ncbi:hypothetical protein AHF37_12379 [Paragonimus kellicotti]|nr:hypothetical protein AHF37_12379 [Paragonimus kellicotti]
MKISLIIVITLYCYEQDLKKIVTLKTKF